MAMPNSVNYFRNSMSADETYPLLGDMSNRLVFTMPGLYAPMRAGSRAGVAVKY